MEGPKFESQISSKNLHFDFSIKILNADILHVFHMFLVHTSAAGIELHTTVTLRYPRQNGPLLGFHENKELELVDGSDNLEE